MALLARLAVRNHGLDEMVEKHFDMSRKFFQLPVEKKMEIITDGNAKCASGRSHARSGDAAIPEHAIADPISCLGVDVAMPPGRGWSGPSWAGTRLTWFKAAGTLTSARHPRYTPS